MHRFPFLFAALLSLCTSLVPGTALWLEDLDPLSADPAGFSVALDLPDGLGVLPGRAMLSLMAEHPDRGTVGGTWALDALSVQDGRWTFRMAEADRRDVRRVQSEVRAWKEADPDRTLGSLSFALGGCRTDVAADLSDARASVFMSLSSDAPLRPVLRQVPIARVLSEADIALLPTCP